MAYLLPIDKAANTLERLCRAMGFSSINFGRLEEFRAGDHLVMQPQTVEANEVIATGRTVAIYGPITIADGASITIEGTGLLRIL